MPTTATKPAGIGSLIAHPLRVRCLVILTERIASPAEMARELDERLDTVYYHVDQLQKAGAIELVREAPKRGSMEHFYRAIQRPEISDEESAELSDEERLEWTRMIAVLTMADIDHSIAMGLFAKRANHSVIRYPAVLDDQGWEEMAQVEEERLRKAMGIEARSAGRIAENGAKPIPTRICSFVFEMPS